MNTPPRTFYLVSTLVECSSLPGNCELFLNETLFCYVPYVVCLAWFVYVFSPSLDYEFLELGPVGSESWVIFIFAPKTTWYIISAQKLFIEFE